jgi:hypothetical protein
MYMYLDLLSSTTKSRPLVVAPLEVHVGTTGTTGSTFTTWTVVEIFTAYYL